MTHTESAAVSRCLAPRSRQSGLARMGLLAALGLLNPVIAGAAMAASSVSVVGNALLLRRWRPVQ